MNRISRIGDEIQGGAHCHGGHTHPPVPTPGTIVEGSTKVFIEGRGAARQGDRGFSPACCAGIGDIELSSGSSKVFIEGRPAVHVGSETIHCEMAPGLVVTGSSKVQVG